MPDIEPITREETLLDGGDLTPITRKEMFIKKIYDKTQTIPEPITREEYFLKKAGEGSGGDVTIEQLNVTQNGTYSESGKAYSPVVVNVKTPDNAYLLEDAEGLPSDIASFEASELPMNKLKVGIEPQQDLSHGDPSPTNICPISGWDECKPTVCGKNLWDRDNIRRGVYTNSDGTTQSGSASTNFSSQFIKVKPNMIYSIIMFGESYKDGSLFAIYYDEYKNGIKQTANIQNLISNNSKTFTTPSNAYYVVFTGYRGAGTDIFTTANTMVCEGTPTDYEPYNGHTYTIDLDGTRYGGKLDVVSGVLTVDRASVTLNGSENHYSIQSSSADDNTVLRVATGQACKQNENQKSNYGTFDNNAWQRLESKANTFVLGSEGNLYLQLPSSTASTIAEFKALFASNPLQVVYELTTPLTIQLTPTQVKSLLGQNNIWADTGKVLEAEYFTKGE